MKSKLTLLEDKELLSQIKVLVTRERSLLIDLLRHLKEVERRRLFSDLRYSSLFEYAVKELKYSESQAGRRIAAMRAIKDLPEIEGKIASGALSLSNVCIAQRYFREVKKGQSAFVGTTQSDEQSVSGSLDSFGSQSNADNSPQSDRVLQPQFERHGRELEPEVKLKVFESLSGKTSREAERIMVTAFPTVNLCKERERVVKEDQIELKFFITNEIRAKVEKYKSLLGHQGSTLGFAEVLDQLLDSGIEAAKIKKFGKRVLKKPKDSQITARALQGVGGSDVNGRAQVPSAKDGDWTEHESLFPTDFDDERELAFKASPLAAAADPNGHRRLESMLKVKPQPPKIASKRMHKTMPQPRSISKAKRYTVWEKAKGACEICKGTRFLEVDHRVPVAIGGGSEIENLRLLCASCNSRQAQLKLGDLNFEVGTKKLN